MGIVKRFKLDEFMNDCHSELKDRILETLNDIKDNIRFIQSQSNEYAYIRFKGLYVEEQLLSMLDEYKEEYDFENYFYYPNTDYTAIYLKKKTKVKEIDKSYHYCRLYKILSNGDKGILRETINGKLLYGRVLIQKVHSYYDDDIVNMKYLTYKVDE